MVEQLNCTDISPYASRNGKFIQIGMFVGRDRETEKLALTVQYTRVFSGRFADVPDLPEESDPGPRLPHFSTRSSGAIRRSACC